MKASSGVALFLPEPDQIIARPDEVHVWQASLALSTRQLRHFRETLSEDERRKAERFHFERDRHHYVAARGILREILARYLRREPDQLRFGYTSFGKPFLLGESGPGRLSFNLSHSSGLALYAVTREREIGIDLERIRSDMEYESIAKRFFSPREVAALLSLPPSERGEAFFNCWTRKEAYIKARGDGLSLPLDGFDVSLAPGEPAALLTTRGRPEDASRWSLRDFYPSHGYVAALAVEGHDWRLRCWRWPE